MTGGPEAARLLDLSGAPEIVHPVSCAGVLSVLRGTRGDRPDVDRAATGGLREHLQDQLAGFRVPDLRGGPVMLGWREIFGDGAPPSVLPLAERLAGLVFRQWVTSRRVDDPLDDALDALRASDSGAATVRSAHRLGPAERARLRRALADHARWLQERWPPLDARWAPVTGELLLAPLAGGHVVVGARTDLALGLPARHEASRCFVVAGIAPPGPAAWRRLRLAALAEALSAGAPPFQLTVLATGTGELTTQAVDPEQLWATAGAVAAALRSGRGRPAIRRAEPVAPQPSPMPMAS